MKFIAKLSLFIFCALVLTSCVETNGQLTATEAVLKIQEDQKKQLTEFEKRRKKLIEEQQARLKASSSAGKNVSAFVKPVAPAPKPKTKRPVRKASVGGRARKSGNIIQNASLSCVPKGLRSVIYQVSRKFGTVIVNSTGRSRRHNRRVGGARRSYHIGCRAVDFRVRGSSRGLYRFLRNHPNVGGLKRYRSGFYHIDNGPRRSW